MDTEDQRESQDDPVTFLLLHRQHLQPDSHRNCQEKYAFGDV